MADKPQPAPSGTDGGGADNEVDSIAQVTPLRRVDSVGTLMVPIHRELQPKPPAKPERIGVALTLRPFTPPSKARTMSTMSDLTDQTNPVPQRNIARVKDRHFAAKPRVDEPSSDAHRRPLNDTADEPQTK